MKKYLLPHCGQFYKANLHCHTIFSDGIFSPEEVKQRYQAHGYSVIAFTDHEVLIRHPELRSETFLPLNGVEFNVSSGEKCTHLCFIAKDPEYDITPFYHPDEYRWLVNGFYKDQVIFDKSERYVRDYSTEGVNDMIRRGVDLGFFVTYNHPTWSQESFQEYGGYKGMQAMEIMNYGCYVEGFQEYNPRVYDDLLRQGQRISVIAADDNHRTKDTLGAWTMIKSDKLEYTSIIEALEKGNSYASWGPDIYDLWFEDGKVHITTSPARRILCNYGHRKAGAVSGENGESVTEASFDFNPEDLYFRITVEDAQGKCADTNAYFADQVF